jgi:hypothetical protein
MNFAGSRDSQILHRDKRRGLQKMRLKVLRASAVKNDVQDVGRLGKLSAVSTFHSFNDSTA